MPRVLLIIGGGIAAYKAPELVRQLKARGLGVRCLLTAAAAQFVSPLSLASVSGDKVYDNLFDLTDETEMGHIQLSRDADMILVAPATADLMAKAVHGTAGDLAATTLLATDKPVVMAPAMNVRMWEHAATQRNLAQLQEDGIGFVGPEEGDMACGEFGMGRMSEPSDIAAYVADRLEVSQTDRREADDSGAQPLAGRKIIVTAGPTHEPIDPVRYLANRSSGKQGYAIATALADLGADVHLISGPTALADPSNMHVSRVETAEEMYQAVHAALPASAAIMCAAVADYRPRTCDDQKIKKAEGGVAALQLAENKDILASLASHDRRPALLVGFAAETQNLENYAKDKLARKGCDWVVANNVSMNSDIEGGVMGGEDNHVLLVSQSDTQDFGVLSKQQTAATLAEKIAAHLSADQEQQ